MAKQRTDHEQDGFTLIELLVVVIIIGILAAIAIPGYLNQRERAWQSELVSMTRNVALESEAEATANNGNYATALGADPAAVLVSVNAIYGALNGGVTVDPIVISVADADPDSFAFCARHVRIAGPHRSEYDSDSGGLQEYVDGVACPVAVVP